MENLNLGKCTVCNGKFESRLDSYGGVCINCSNSHTENTVYNVLSDSESLVLSLRV